MKPTRKPYLTGGEIDGIEFVWNRTGLIDSADLAALVRTARATAAVKTLHHEVPWYFQGTIDGYSKSMFFPGQKPAYRDCACGADECETLRALDVPSAAGVSREATP